MREEPRSSAVPEPQTEVSTVWGDFDLFPGGAAVGLIHGFNNSASAPEPGVYSLDLLRGSALRFFLF